MPQPAVIQVAHSDEGIFLIVTLADGRLLPMRLDEAQAERVILQLTAARLGYGESRRVAAN